MTGLMMLFTEFQRLIITTSIKTHFILILARIYVKVSCDMLSKHDSFLHLKNKRKVFNEIFYIKASKVNYKINSIKIKNGVFEPIVLLICYSDYFYSEW